MDRIDETALKAWPAAEEVRIGAWLVRFSGGYTKRANSAHYRGDGGVARPGSIAACEAFYVQRGFPPTFRLPSSAPAAVDKALAGRGYEIVEPTQVMQLDIRPPHVAGNPEAIETQPISTWVETYHAFRGPERPHHPEHARILSRIRASMLPAILRRDGVAVSCALGVLDGPDFGIFDMVTAPEARGRGYAGVLLSSMLGWAQQRGATRAYLQVVEANRVAVDLYLRLGFEPLHRYWYRVNRYLAVPTRQE